jgi:splicing factor 3A subunit 2
MTDSSSIKAQAELYLTKNALGQYRCTLCDTLHKDEANFAVHVGGKNHQTNLKVIELRRAQQRQEQQEKIAIAKQDAHAAHQEQLAQLSNNAISTGSNNQQRGGAMMMMMGHSGTTVDPRDVKVQIDEIPGKNRMQSRITFTIEFPLAAPTSRPMHRWMNTFEQNVEAKDSSKQYLVFACEPYESIAFAFPSSISVATADNSDNKDVQRYYCEWNPIKKTYFLRFQVGHR